MIPLWLHLLAIASLLVAGACAVVIAVDEYRHPQKMWIMNVVWPLTALFGSLIALWAYLRYGRLAARDGVSDHTAATPFTAIAGKGTTHCGSGCTLGDICAEWLAVLFPTIAVWLGWQTLFPTKMFAVWIIDYAFAFAFGIAFQYFTIKPMRDISPAQGLVAALKADTLSLTAWQLGMYSFMAVAHFWLFAYLLDAKLKTATVEFWFMMQIAMLFGFITSYPVNWWLIRTGLKEPM